MLVTTFNRRIFGLLLLVMLTVNRLLGWASGTSISRVLLTETLTITGICAAAGLLLQRMFWVGVPIFGAPLAIGVVDPRWVSVAINISTLLTLVIIVLAWRRGLAARHEDRESNPSTR